MTDCLEGAQLAVDRLAGNVRHSLLGTTAARVFGALGGLFAARLLGPALRGQYAVAFTLATIGSMLTAAGLQFWVVVAVASGAGRRRVGRTVALHAGIVVLLNVTFVSLAVATQTLAFGLDHWELVGIGMLSTTAALGMIFMAAPIGARKMRHVALASSVGACTFAISVGLLLVMNLPSVPLVVAAAALGSLVSSSIAFLSFWRLTIETRPTESTLSTWLGAIRNFLGAGLGEVVLVGMLRIDFLVMASLRPLRDVGLYAVAVSATEVLWVVPDAAAQVALPVAASGADLDTVPKLFRSTLMITAIAGLTLTIASPVVLPLIFGNGYQSASTAVPLLAVAAVAAGAWRIIGADVAARGRTSTRFYTALLGMLAMVALDMVAIPRWGLIGGSLGSAGGYLIAAFSIILIWGRLPGARPSELARFHRSDFTLWKQVVRRARVTA